MLSAYEYQNSLITKRIYLGGHAQNSCDKAQMTLVYIETKVLSIAGTKETSWAHGIPPQRGDAAGTLPNQVTATKIKSTVTTFKVMSQTLFNSGGFYDTSGQEYKDILYLDNSGAAVRLYIGDGASGYDADGFELLLHPTGRVPQNMFDIM
jgi:hypothetical protein